MSKNELTKLLFAGSTASFAIEGKFTNLRVWLSHSGPGKYNELVKPAEHIYMRLDIANQSNVPFTKKVLSYLNNQENPIVLKLLELVDFTTSINNLDLILDILLTMKPRECVVW